MHPCRRAAGDLLDPGGELLELLREVARTHELGQRPVVLAEVEAEPLDRHPVALEQVVESRRIAGDRAAGSRLRLGGSEALLDAPG